MLIFEPLSHINKHLIFEVDLVILADNQALILAIKDFLVKLSRPVYLDHFGQACRLVHIDVV